MVSYKTNLYAVLATNPLLVRGANRSLGYHFSMSLVDECATCGMLSKRPPASILDLFFDETSAKLFHILIVLMAHALPTFPLYIYKYANVSVPPQAELTVRLLQTGELGLKSHSLPQRSPRAGGSSCSLGATPSSNSSHRPLKVLATLWRPPTRHTWRAESTRSEHRVPTSHSTGTKQWRKSAIVGRTRSLAGRSAGPGVQVILSSSANGLHFLPATTTYRHVGRKSIPRGNTLYPSTSFGIRTYRAFGTKRSLVIQRLCTSRRQLVLHT